MPIKSSISHVGTKRRLPERIRLIAALLSVIALIMILVAVLAFTRANRLMRRPAAPLETFSSNILPSFTPVCFLSLDNQTRLYGWFFAPKDPPVSTIILVHDQGRNRLQFGLDSADLYRFLLDRGFCVLAFDLRRSGESDGELAGFGYAEWADVLAAIRYVRQNASTRDVLLFGFGTGTAASLLALEQLPPPGTLRAAADGQPEAEKKLAAYPEDIRNLDFDQGYIRGLLLDTPCSSADEYIRAHVRENRQWDGQLLQHIIPLAVRIASGHVGNGSTGLVTPLTRSQIPVFLAYSREATRVSPESVARIVDERLRLQADTTTVFATAEPGYVNGFSADRENYLKALEEYLEPIASAR